MRLNYKKGQSSIRSKFLAIKLRSSLYLVAEKTRPNTPARDFVFS
jgi:hypothetical protein